MNLAKFMNKFLELKANTSFKISNFVKTYNNNNNIYVINYFNNLINDIFTQFININNDCIYGEFNDFELSPTPNLTTTPSSKAFTNLSVTKSNLFLPTNHININNNININKNLNLPNSNSNFRHINITSFNINAIKVSHNISVNSNINTGYLTQNNINTNAKFYKILKFFNIDTFKNIYDNYIIKDTNITNYEVHVEDLGNKVKIYFLLIEYLEETFNNIYTQYSISFKANTKKKYQNFLKMKGPIVDPDLL